MLLLAAGCGGSADSSGDISVETSSLSKAEFIKKADKVCDETRTDLVNELTAYVEKQNENPAEASKGSPETEAVEDLVVPNLQRQIDEIVSLGAPQGDEEEVSAFLASFQRVVDEASDDPKEFIRNEGSLGRAPKLALAYGLSGCAEIT